MKKSTCVFCTILALFLLLSCSQESWMPRWFEKDHAVEYRDVPTRPNGEAVASITKEQALEDLDLFKYLIETSYAGYEYQKEMRGVNFKGNFRRARRYIRKLDTETISRDDLTRALFIALYNVQDGHFCVDMKYNPFLHEFYYSAGITVIRQDKQYIVAQSSAEGVSPGDQYQGPEKFLFKTYSKDAETYRIGILSRNPVETLALNFNKQTVPVPVKIDMKASVPPPDGVLYTLNDDGVAYLRIPSFAADSEGSFVSEEGRKRLEDVTVHIRKLDEGDTVIVDLRNNPGGYIDTAALVPAILFHRQVKNFLPIIAELISPGTTQARLQNVWDAGDNSDAMRNVRKGVQIEADKQKANPERTWVRQSLRVEAVKPVENTRKILIIINRFSMSASEFLCSIRNTPNVTILGENSAGILNFATPQQYVLPNSQIPLLLPSEIFIDTSSFSAGEGTGVLPDYWVLNDELEDVLRAMTGSSSFTIPAASPPR